MNARACREKAGVPRLGSREVSETVTSRLGHGLAELASDIRDVLTTFAPGLPSDDVERKLLAENIQRNIDAALGALARDPHAIANVTKAALDYAEQLKPFGVTGLTLLRAYRVAERRFLRRIIEELAERSTLDENEKQSMLDLVARVSTYFHEVAEEFIARYAEERREWITPDAVLAARVRSVLSDPKVNLETAQTRVGTYPVCARHLGAEVWMVSPDPAGDAVAVLRRLSGAFAAALHSGETPLFVPVDAASACVWIAIDAQAEVDWDALRAVLATIPGTYAAFGEPATSLAGFRRTHQQAMSAEAVARVNTPPLERLTPYAEIAPIATMAGDIEATRAWVHDTLGTLAVDDPRQASLRETVRIFFETGGSYAATAERLYMHRNTAQYRVRTAEELRGRPFREGRLEVELALLACRWFGRIVLQPASTALAV